MDEPSPAVDETLPRGPLAGGNRSRLAVSSLKTPGFVPRRPPDDLACSHDRAILWPTIAIIGLEVERQHKFD